MFKDVSKSLRNYQRWMILGWYDIKAKYRRSAIGPWWMVIITFISIGSLGAIGSALFNTKFFDFVPIVAAGMLGWTLFTTVINEACLVFIHSTPVIQNLRVNIIDIIMQSLWRNFIVFLHNFLAIFILLALSSANFNIHTLWFIPSLILVFLNCFFVIIILGFLSARYRDVIPLVTTTMTMVFFITPVMWDKAMLQRYQFIIYLNPFAHFIELIRAPLLGRAPDFGHYFYATCLTIALGAISSFIYKRYSHRLVYWL